MRRRCQLEHSLSAHEVKKSIELESVEKRGMPPAKKEDEEGVLTKLHNIRLECMFSFFISLFIVV